MCCIMFQSRLESFQPDFTLTKKNNYTKKNWLRKTFDYKKLWQLSQVLILKQQLCHSKWSHPVLISVPFILVSFCFLGCQRSVPLLNANSCYSYHFSSNLKFFCVSSAIDFQSSSGVRAAQGAVDAKKSTRSLHISQNLLT